MARRPLRLSCARLYFLQEPPATIFGCGIPSVATGERGRGRRSERDLDGRLGWIEGLGVGEAAGSVAALMGAAREAKTDLPRVGIRQEGGGRARVSTGVYSVGLKTGVPVDRRREPGSTPSPPAARQSGRESVNAPRSRPAANPTA